MYFQFTVIICLRRNVQTQTQMPDAGRILEMFKEIYGIVQNFRSIFFLLCTYGYYGNLLLHIIIYFLNLIQDK